MEMSFSSCSGMLALGYELLAIGYRVSS
jgi:hypothetical protein